VPYPSPRIYPGPSTYPGIDEAPATIPAKVGAAVPHFNLPFRFGGGAASVVDQDTTDDVLACVLAIMLCPKGYRAELPDFGVEEMTFDEREPDLTKLAQAIIEWEPRADALLTTAPDRFDDLVHYVAVRLGTRSAD
jgi:phage baseplate assembly protein W